MTHNLFKALLGIALAGFALLAHAAAQEDPDAAIARAHAAYEDIRASVEDGDIENPEELEQQLRTLREQSRQRLAAAERERTAVQDQLGVLGPAPGENDPPETEELAAQRAELNASLARLTSRQVQINANIAAANELLAGIASSRVQTLYEKLFDRGESPLSPALWRPAWASASETFGKIGHYFSNWAAGKKTESGLGLSVLLISLAFGFSLFIFWPLNRWVMSTFSDAIAQREPTPGRRVVVAGLKMIARAAPGIIAGFVIIETLRAQGVLDEQGESVAHVLWLVIVDYLLVSGFLSGLFAPANPKWRIAPVDAARGRIAGALLISIVIIFGLTILVTEIFATAGAAEELIRFVDAAGAIAIGVIIFLLCRGRLWRRNIAALKTETGETAATPQAAKDTDDEAEEEPNFLGWRLLRRAGRALAVLTVVAALSGYVEFAIFIASRIYYLALILAVAWFVRALLRETSFWAYARFSETEPKDGGDDKDDDTGGVSDNFRFWTNWIINFALMLVLIPVALILAGIPWANVADMAVQAFFGFRIGSVSVPSLAKIFYALIVFIAVLALTKVVQRAIQAGPLKHSSIDIGVQNSFVTLIGYAGLVIAFFVGVSAIGFDLGNLALIAGALSVGIGFGLQSIVNNFVSGLILLFERPIKVGDWIVTNSGEGIVKKISVRSTEIETWDRSSIIIPNSEMISAPVTNWTHKNKIGRITVPVGVSYGSDPEQVKEILLKCANDHPNVVRYPEPFVVWQDFGASSLDFEIRAYLSDISNGLGVRTQLRFAIFKALKDAGVEIPFPQRDVHVKSWPDAATAAAKPDSEEGSHAGA